MGNAKLFCQCTVFACLYFKFKGNFQVRVPWGLYLEGRFKGRFFALRVWGGLILRNFTILLYRLILCLYPSVKPTVTFKRCPTPVTEGHNATLYCNATGYPVPNFAWINASSGNIESPTKTLVITAITRSQRGIYICHASNEIGNGTQTCEIDVYCKLHLLLNRRFY